MVYKLCEDAIKKRVKDGKANENRDVLFWFLVEF